MAFKNEYLTEEEKQMIAEAKIHDPRYQILTDEILKISNWTIDKENDIALTFCGEVDRFERCNQDVFALFYKGFNSEHLISVILVRKRFDKETASKLEKKYEVDGVQKWILIDKKIPKRLYEEIDDEEVYKILIDALSEYGINGRNDQDYTIKAFLEVGGEIIS